MYGRNGTCVSDTGTYAIVVWSFCTSELCTLGDRRTSAPPLAVANPVLRIRKDAPIHAISKKLQRKQKARPPSVR